MSEKKTESLNPLKMIKLGVILAIYACVACVGLAFVYSGTLDIITLREQEALEHALQVVFPNADSFSAISALASTDPAVTIEDAYAVFARGELIGAAIRTSRFSYSGPIKILVGVGVDNRISGIQILDNIDTPGLGSNASSRSYFVDRPHGIRFYDQFAGKSVSDPFIPKQDVIAIAAATITSRAVTSSVKAAGEAAVAWFTTGGSR